MTKTSLTIQHSGASRAADPADSIHVPDRMVHLFVKRVYEPGPDRLAPQYRELAGIYAVSVPGSLSGKRMANCALDGFHAKFGPENLLRFRITVVDPTTGRAVERDRRTPWDALAGRCKDITMVKRFRSCTRGFVMADVEDVEQFEDMAGVEGGGGTGKHPVVFNPVVRELHLRVAIPGVQELEHMDDEDRSVPGVYAITVASDLPVTQLANCALDAFHTQISIECSDGFAFTVTDPSTGKALGRDERLKCYGLAHRCFGVQMLEPLISRSTNRGCNAAD